jgi:hypothetical protein
MRGQHFQLVHGFLSDLRTCADDLRNYMGVSESGF